MLGTAQFGNAYGIANKTGRPSFPAVLKIIESAAANGINCLDTAPIYGASEEVIGKALQELGIAGRMVVATKVPTMAENLQPARADYVVEQTVVSSLQRLRLEVLPVCLFHSERNAGYADSLLKMKEKGLVGHVGISVNSPEWALNAIRSGNFEVLQIPTSIFDHRYYKNGIFREAKRNGLALFVRSVYLQGLVFLPDSEMPPHLMPVIDVRRRLEQMAGRANMSLADLAVRFVLSLDGVDCLVMGLETIAQLQKNIKLFAQGPLKAELRDEILKSVPQLPDQILMPSLWPSRHLPPVGV